MKLIMVFFALFAYVAHANGKESELKIIQLTNNVYQHISYKEVASYGMVGASGLIVVDENDAYVIDTPRTKQDTEELADWIRSKGLIFKGSVVTHYHEDASGGIPFLNSSMVKTYATPLTNKLLSGENRENSSDVMSTTSFELIKNRIEIFYPGAGHTEDNIVVWLPKEKILFGGCFVKSMSSKSLGYIGNASIQDWPESIQNVINKYPDVKVVVPGHGKVGTINLLKHTAKMALDANL